jgi:nitrogen regulatory protein PII
MLPRSGNSGRGDYEGGRNVQWVKIIMPAGLLEEMRRKVQRVRPGTQVVSDAALSGPGASRAKVYRGAAYLADMPGAQLEFAVADEHKDDVLKAVADAIEPNPGLEVVVLFHPVDDLVRLRSGPCGVHMS